MGLAKAISKECEECGCTFDTFTTRAKYCTKKCRDAVYYRQKKKAKEEKLKEYLGGEYRCTRCGYTKDAIGYFDLHHRNRDEKEKSAITLLLNASWEVAKEEIDKCDLLCPTCHREVHIEQSGRSNR